MVIRSFFRIVISLVGAVLPFLFLSGSYSPLGSYLPSLLNLFGKESSLGNLSRNTGDSSFADRGGGADRVRDVQCLATRFENSTSCDLLATEHGYVADDASGPKHDACRDRRAATKRRPNRPGDGYSPGRGVGIDKTTRRLG